MNQPSRARQNAAQALLRLIQEYEGPFTEEQRALHCMDAIAYYVCVLYQLPIPKHTPSPMEQDCIGLMGTLIDQIREVVDQDTADSAEWYQMILKVRELVGVTR